MRKLNWWSVALVILMISCSSGAKDSSEGKDESGWEVTIRGKVGFPGQGEIKIAELRPDKPTPWEDTLKLKSNYTFEKKLRISEPGYYQLNFFNAQFVNIIIDRSNLEVNVDGNSQSGFFEVKGSPDQDVMIAAQKIVQDARGSKEAGEIQAKFELAVQRKDNAQIRDLQLQFQQVIIDKAIDQVAEFIKKQPLSLGLIATIQGRTGLSIDKYFPVYLELAGRFKKDWPSNYYAREFVANVERQKATAIGQPAPEISLPNPEGKLISLSSFKGKYVLIDFWAKWCGPCRQENPNIVKAYHQFKDKGFDILGVSLDRSKEDWVKAIQDDGLAWNQVSDLKYWNSKPAADYNVSAIPFSVLVDPQGIIVAKNLRGAELHQKLEEVLNK